MLSVAARVRRAREASSTLQESIFQARAPDTGLELYDPETSEAATGWRRLAKPAILAWSTAIAVALIVIALLLRSGATPKRLDLTSTLTGNSLRLSWTRSAPVALASEGLLNIVDGEHKQELPLNSKQLHEETVVYIPKSDKVSFTLQVFAEGVVHRDSILVFTPHPPGVAASAAATPPPSIPAQPPARPETVARTLSPPRIEDPKATRQVTATPPEPGPPAPPPVVDATSVRASIPAQPEPAPSPAKEPVVTDPRIVLPSPERRQDPRIIQLQPRPEPLRKPPAPPVVPPASQTSPAEAVTAPPVVRHPPQPTRQVKPIVPRTLKALITREIVMDVNLSIDEYGKVVKAEPSTGSGILQTSLGKLAADAARHWSSSRPAWVTATWLVKSEFNSSSVRAIRREPPSNPSAGARRKFVGGLG